MSSDEGHEIISKRAKRTIPPDGICRNIFFIICEALDSSYCSMKNEILNQIKEEYDGELSYAIVTRKVETPKQTTIMVLIRVKSKVIRLNKISRLDRFSFNY